MDAMLAWAVILASDKTAGEPQSEARNANTGSGCERAKPRAIDFYGHFTEITQGNPGTPMDATGHFGIGQDCKHYGKRKRCRRDLKT